MNAVKRGVWIIAWWSLLVAIAVGISHTVKISGDLRSFMPPAQSDDQKLLMDEIGNGPASQLLLLAIGNAPQENLAALSTSLAQKLRDDPTFAQVINGENLDAQLNSDLLPYRYLLSPTLDSNTFDAAFLHDELQQRVEDLASPAADMLKDILPRDPTLEVLKLVQRWMPAKAPLTRDGVWFSARGEALLLAQTKAAGFDPGSQTAAIASLDAAFAQLPGVGDAKLTISGPGYFGAKVAATTRSEAEHLSALGTTGFLLPLLIAYRNGAVIALVGLPLASGALAGLAAIALGFGDVHGITLAFGFTLLGVAQEYPIRVFSHRRSDASTQQSVAAVWPLLRLAVVSACIAYVAFFASGVPGLQQLAVFTITGLLVAGAATRWMLPPLLPTRFHDAAALPFIERVRVVIASIPKPRWLPWLLFAIALLALFYRADA